MNLSWQFDSKDVDDGRGWNNPVISEFKHNKIKSLTCETIQNSLDNPDKQTKEPVTVVFAETTKTREQIPGIDELKSRLASCLDRSKNESEDAVEEIKVALEMASAEKVPCLQISDFNTTGMAGPDTRGNPFHTYIKTEGSSGGAQNRAGSHGHGKAAPLTLSDLRSIVASTNWGHSPADSLTQGRATFMTHGDEGQNFDAIGYWGADNYKAVNNLPSQHSWLAHPKKTLGTTITILGFQRYKNWESLVVGYALANYFPAFIRGKLVLKVGRHEVSNDTFMGYLSDQDMRIRFAKQDPELHNALELTDWYVQCLTRDKENGVFPEVKQMDPQPGRGVCNLLVEEGAPRRIGIIRNNMLITDARSCPTFYQRIPGDIKDFVGIYECLNEKGNKFLRSMEPPQHNDLSAGFLPASKYEQGVSALKKLGNGLKDIVVKRARISFGDGAEVAWMNEFFADEAGDGAEVNLEEDINPDGQFEIKPRPKSLPTPKILKKVIKPDPDPDPDPDPGPDPDPDPDPIPKPDPKPKPQPEPKVAHPALKHSRLVKISDDEYRVFIRSSADIAVRIDFHEIGADFYEELPLLSSSMGILQGASVKLSLKVGDNVFEVAFKRPVLGGLTLVGYED
jgi:hypothetical protein